MFSYRAFSECMSEVDMGMSRATAENRSSVVAGLRELSDQYLLKLTREDWHRHRDEIERIMSEKSVYSRMLVYDWYASVLEEDNYIDKMLSELEKDELTSDEKRYAIEQLRGRIFRGTTSETTDRVSILEREYIDVIRSYEEQLEVRPVPTKEERNQNLVVVMTGQLLLPQHAPTKTALNLCRILIEKMGKQVVLINVADSESQSGEIPLAQYSVGNYIDSYSRFEYMPYIDVKIPLIQLDRGLPSMSGIQGMVDMLCEFKPAYMFMIGSGSVVMDMCAKYVPTLLVPMVSSVDYTRAAFQMMHVKKLPEDGMPDADTMKRLEELGKTEDHILLKRIGCVVDEQKGVGNRKEFGIPQGRFVGVIVGNRLDTELKDDFIIMLEKCASKGLFIVFVGRMGDRYYEISKESNSIAENSIHIEYANDIMSLYECCDLFINPRRTGGGISAIDALYKGVPVVTLPEGDVYDNIGDSFAVNGGYDEMEDEIIRYMNDEMLYQKKSDQAREIAHQMVEKNDLYYVDAIHELEDRLR